VGWVKIIFMAVIIAVCIFFFMQNTEQVTIRFGLSPLNEYKFFETPRVPLFLVILCSVVLGVLMGGVYDLYRRFQLGVSLRQKQKTIDRLEKEIQSLRGSDLEESSSLKKES
jgi:putative membrane protein